LLEAAPASVVRVVASDGAGHELAWTGETDADGVAEVSLPGAASARRRELSVWRGDTLLARGAVELRADVWRAAATRRGGWRTVKLSATTELELAPARGLLVAPFPGDLLLRVRRAGQALKASLELSAQGGSVQPKRAETGADPVRVVLVPQAHVMTLQVRATPREGPAFDARIELPVAPAALDVAVDGPALRVRSAAPRDLAYFTLVTEDRRLFGGSVRLAPEPSGLFSGQSTLPALPDQPCWLVVGSTPDLATAARVGYPISAQPEPAQTFDVPEHLLLDGLPVALSRESARRKQARLVAAVACMLSLLLTALLLFMKVRGARRELDEHFARGGFSGEIEQRLVPARPLWLVAALAALSLGFVLLLVFALAGQ
jgi:hypothetical protein